MKYQNGDNTSSFEDGRWEGEPFLYNIENCYNLKDIIITDKELSILEKTKLTSICSDICYILDNTDSGITSHYSFLEEKDRVILHLNNKELQNVIALRLKNTYEIVENKIIPFHIPELAEITERLLETAYNFIDLGNPALNNLLGGFPMNGEVTIFSGSPGSGKSIFTMNIIAILLAKDQRVAIYSGELSNEKVLNKIASQLFGIKYCDVVLNKFNGASSVEIKKECRKTVAKFISKRLDLYGDATSKKSRSPLEVFKEAYEKHGTKIFIYDNLMSSNISSFSNNKYEAQTQFILDIKNFVKSIKGHFIIVAHPRKTNGDKKGTIFDFELDSISGTMDLPNTADTVIFLGRMYPSNEDDKDYKKFSESKDYANTDKEADVVALVRKDRTFGLVNRLCYFTYVHPLGRYFSPVNRQDKIHLNASPEYTGELIKLEGLK